MTTTNPQRGIAADLASTAADIASDVRLIGQPCQASVDHARALLDLLDLLDPSQPVPFTLTPKAHAALGPALAGDGEDTALEDAAQAAWEAECDATWWETVTAMSAAGLLDGHQDPDPTSGEWACETCGDGYFGTLPEDGLCEACRAAVDGQPGCEHCGQADCECWKLDDTRPAVTREIPAYEWE